jgi:hypothetical protein
VLRFVSDVSLEGSVQTVRILIAVKPRMYGEVVALFLHRRRPNAEVLISPPEALDGEVVRFRPHLVVCSEGAVPEIPPGVLCRVEIMCSDGLNARISLDGRVAEAKDVRMEDLLALVDRTEQMILEERAD